MLLHNPCGYLTSPSNCEPETDGFTVDSLSNESTVKVCEFDANGFAEDSFSNGWTVKDCERATDDSADSNALLVASTGKVSCEDTIPVFLVWCCTDAEVETDLTIPSQDPELWVDIIEGLVGLWVNWPANPSPWKYGKPPIGPCCVWASWNGLQNGAYRVKGIGSEVCQGTNCIGEYKVGFHVALSEVDPGNWSSCFSFACGVRTFCRLCSGFLVEYSCRFTWTNRSEGEKMKSGFYCLSTFGNDWI